MSLLLMSSRFGGPPPSQGSDEPFDLSYYRTNGLFDHFTVEPAWPTAPTTTSTHNVDTIGELQTAVAIDGARVVIGAGLTLTGNVNITGDDVDVECPNDTTIVGIVYAKPAGAGTIARVRWTGGILDMNAENPALPSGPGSTLWWRAPTDLLFNNVRILGLMHFSEEAFTRLAFINCTIDIRGNVNPSDEPKLLRFHAARGRVFQVPRRFHNGELFALHV